MKIFVTVKLKAKKEEIRKVDETHFLILVKEPPIQGKANIAIIKAFAKYFDTPPSRIEIISGQTSKYKTLEII